MPCLTMTLSVLPLLGMAAEAQTEEARQTDSRVAVETAATALDETVQAAAAEARRLLASALGGDDGALRWTALRAAGGLSEPWIAELVLPLCDSPDVIERTLAMEVVANTDPGVGEAVFVEALTSGERPIRLRALLGLAALRDPDTIPAIAEILATDPDPDLRAAAARTLGAIGDDGASAALHAAITGSYPPVREQAVIALLAIGDRDVGDFLIQKLGKNQRPGDQEILRLLALVPDPALIGRIEPYLKHDDEAVRILAATAIFSILERSTDAPP